MEYWMYKDANGHFRWYLKAANGRKIANSGEGYYNRQDCIDAVRLVMSTTNQTPFYEN